MPLSVSPSGFIILIDTESGFINYSIPFRIAGLDIRDLFDSTEDFDRDIFEEGELKSLEYHVSKGNVKIINGDLYFRNPRRFTESGKLLIDVIIPHIIPEISDAQLSLLSSFTNGQPFLEALAENREAVTEQVYHGEITSKILEEANKWKTIRDAYNAETRRILSDDKYKNELYVIS